MLQDLTGGEPVPAAQDQDVARLRDPAERRMNQRLVATIFVAGGELKIAVEEEPEIDAPAGEDDRLEQRRFGVDEDRTRGEKGKSVLGQVDHRGRQIIKKTTHNQAILRLRVTKIRTENKS